MSENIYIFESKNWWLFYLIQLEKIKTFGESRKYTVPLNKYRARFSDVHCI
jgi:hypothetical protein